MRSSLLANGYIPNKSYFKDFAELEEMRKVIFHYLKPYLKYESEKLSLADKISSELVKKKKIDLNVLSELRKEVRALAENLNNSIKSKNIFKKILNTESIKPCTGFHDFRFNLSQDYKISTGWHQDCETSFIEGKDYWRNLSCTAWIALSNANKKNSIFILPRKNNSFYIYPQHYGKIGNVDYRKKTLEQIDANLNMKNVYAVDVKAGECVFLDSFVLHRTIPGKSIFPRFSIDIRYYDYNTDLSDMIKIHPKVYFFKLLKSKTYLNLRNSKIIKPIKLIRKVVKNFEKKIS